jgi:hypothetical protein
MRKLLKAAAVTAAAAGLVIGGAGLASASWAGATVGGYTTGGVSLRDCYHPSVHLPPSQACTYLKTIAPGTPAHVVCQTVGQDIYGDSLWDYVVTSAGEGFMSDYYVNTGYAGWIPGIDHCS